MFFPITPPPLPEPTPIIVEYAIRSLARTYQVDEKTAIRIGWCESRFKADARNSQSSATGVYQFTVGTWEYIKAEGSPLDFEENIKQFMIHYPKHPEWWQCK